MSQCICLFYHSWTFGWFLVWGYLEYSCCEASHLRLQVNIALVLPGWKSSDRIAVSQDMCRFRVSRSCQTVSQVGSVNVHPPQQCMRVLLAPNPSKDLVQSEINKQDLLTNRGNDIQ